MLRYRSLIAQTGRQSEAVSKAIKSLEELGLVHRVVAGSQRIHGFANRDGGKSEARQYKEKK